MNRPLQLVSLLVVALFLIFAEGPQLISTEENIDQVQNKVEETIVKSLEVSKLQKGQEAQQNLTNSNQQKSQENTTVAVPNNNENANAIKDKNEATTISNTINNSSGSPEENNKPNNSSNNSSVIVISNSSSSSTSTTETPLSDHVAVEQEHNSSLSLFFVICVIMLGILLIHSMLQTGFQYLPESIVVVFLGALIGEHVLWF